MNDEAPAFGWSQGQGRNIMALGGARMSKDKIHHKADASQIEELARLSSEATGGWTPPQGETLDRVELGFTIP